MPGEVREYLDTHTAPGKRVLEWGAGGSTLRFAELGAQVVSVEHTRKWYWIVEHALLEAQLFDHVTLLWVPPDRDDAGPDFWDVEGRSLKRYVRSGAQHARRTKKADLVLVDGRARVACCRRVLADDLLAREGVLVLDDADRARYKPAINVLNERYGPPVSLGRAKAWHRRK